MKKEDKKLTTIRNLTIFLLLIFLTFYIVFKDADTNAILYSLKNSDKKFVVIAIGFMCIYLFLEGANIKRTLGKLGDKISYRSAIRYSLIGFFFSGITPAASGGQPMQIYYMHKDNIKISRATITLLLNLLSMQIVTISMALISFMFNFKELDVGLIIFFIIGIFLNSIALGLLLMGIFSKKMAESIINFIIKILKKLKIKKAELIKEKLYGELSQYQSCSDYIKTHKRIMIKMLLITYIQFFCYFSITYWVYKALGFTGNNIFKIVSMQSVVFGTVSGIPSPGAVGVSEAAYLGIFKKIMPGNYLNTAMLMSRGINFYIFIIISSIAVIYSSIKEKKTEEIQSNEKK